MLLRRSHKGFRGCQPEYSPGYCFTPSRGPAPLATLATRVPSCPPFPPSVPSGRSTVRLERARYSVNRIRQTSRRESRGRGSPPRSSAITLGTLRDGLRTQTWMDCADSGRVISRPAQSGPIPTTSPSTSAGPATPHSPRQQRRAAGYQEDMELRRDAMLQEDDRDPFQGGGQRILLWVGRERSERP